LSERQKISFKVSEGGRLIDAKTFSLMTLFIVALSKMMLSKTSLSLVKHYQKKNWHGNAQQKDLIVKFYKTYSSITLSCSYIRLVLVMLSVAVLRVAM
jgi:hypothetical protein